MTASLQSAIMSAILQDALTEENGLKVCHIDAAAVLDTLSLISASMIATSPEAATAEGLKRLLRRQARQVERRVSEFRRHAKEHGTPFRGAA